MTSTFKLLLDVQGVWAEFDGKVQPVGFFVTRMVDAHNLQEALVMATAALKASSDFKAIVRNEPNNPPRIVLDEHEIVDRESEDHSETGFLFYDSPIH